MNTEKGGPGPEELGTIIDLNARRKDKEESEKKFPMRRKGEPFPFQDEMDEVYRKNPEYKQLMDELEADEPDEDKIARLKRILLEKQDQRIASTKVSPEERDRILAEHEAKKKAANKDGAKRMEVDKNIDDDFGDDEGAGIFKIGSDGHAYKVDLEGNRIDQKVISKDESEAITESDREAIKVEQKTVEPLFLRDMEKKMRYFMNKLDEIDDEELLLKAKIALAQIEKVKEKENPKTTARINEALEKDWALEIYKDEFIPVDDTFQEVIATYREFNEKFGQTIVADQFDQMLKARDEKKEKALAKKEEKKSLWDKLKFWK